jgi:hypothetical protein
MATTIIVITRMGITIFVVAVTRIVMNWVVVGGRAIKLGKIVKIVCNS